jgi:hypothetical protein
MTNLENGNLSSYFLHPDVVFEVTSADKLYGDLFSPMGVEAEFDLSEFALAESLEEDIRTKLGDCPVRVGSGVADCGRMLLDVECWWLGILLLSTTAMSM